MDRPPWFWLIAGPNGAGKSTLAGEQYGDLKNINPDTIAQQLRPSQPGQVAVSAGKKTIKAVQDALNQGHSFSLETTLSGKMHFDLLRVARRDGWAVGLAYICVEDPDDAVLRVRERYRLGGHNVSPADVRRRYRRSLANLPEAIRCVDVAVLYDNSTADGYRRVMEAKDNKVTYVVKRPPNWLTQSLAEYLPS